MGMKMTYGDLISGDSFVRVVVRISHDPLLCRGTVLGTEIEVRRHALPGSSRCVIQREIIHKAASLTGTPPPNLIRRAGCPVFLFAIALPHSDGERILIVLAIVNVSKIQLDLAGKKKLCVGGRKASEPPLFSKIASRL